MIFFLSTLTNLLPYITQAFCNQKPLNNYILNICNIYTYIKGGYSYYNLDNRKRLLKLYILLVAIILLYSSSKLLDYTTNIKGLIIIINPFYIRLRLLEQYILKVLYYFLNRNSTINNNYYLQYIYRYRYFITIYIVI